MDNQKGKCVRCNMYKEGININMKPKVTRCKYQECGCCAYCNKRCVHECLEVPDTCDGVVEVINVS